MKKIDHDQPVAYEIRIEGLLDAAWSGLFDGFIITTESDETVLKGTPVDQAALMGLLTKMVGFGFVIKRVTRLKED